MMDEGVFWIDEKEGVLIIKNCDGIEDKFVIDEQLEIGTTTYLILIPNDMIDNEDAEAFVLKIVNDGDEEFLSVIDDDSEFEMVKEEYLSQE